MLDAEVMKFWPMTCEVVLTIMVVTIYVRFFSMSDPGLSLTYLAATGLNPNLSDHSATWKIKSVSSVGRYGGREVRLN